MPVRFQVDPDFYDHPKTTGMSDAAFSLWVRAGSFSAAKLTDGFVSDDVLAYTLRATTDAADELVRRGLWRRAKGGYRFHEWAERNLTKQRVDADREADRDRKRAQRYGNGVTAKPVTCYGCGTEFVTAKPNARYCSDPCKQKAYRDRKAGNAQAATGDVHPESERNPDGIRADSGRIPGVSVSVSVSESVSGSGRGDDSGDSAAPGGPGPKPPTRCPDHTDDPKPPPCGRCKEAREAAEEWQRDHDAANRAAAAEAAAARTAELERRAEINRAAIAACTRCDEHGQVRGTPCTHEPGKADRARRGADLVRAAVAKVGSP